MIFDAAGSGIHPIIPPAIMFIVSFFTSMGGVSGAFLLLPFQVSVLGFTSPAVSATNQLYNIVAIPGGVYNYIKEGRMPWPLVLIVTAGTLPGVFAGAFLRIEYLPGIDEFKLFASFVLIYIGSRLVAGILNKNRRKEEGRMSKSDLPEIRTLEFSASVYRFEFMQEEYSAPVAKIFIISLVVGVAGGIYGIGGGAVMAPLFVGMFGLPVYVVAGASLFGTLITSVAAVAFFQLLSYFYTAADVAPDWELGILFGTGGLLGIYLGSKFQKYFNPLIIKWILAVIIFFVAAKYVYDFFKIN